MALDPAVAATRSAVRALDLGPGPIVVACSGGADSLALLAAACSEARSAGWHIVGTTVDHGLQEQSAEVAARVAAQMAEVGAHETVKVRVQVEGGGAGPEAAARNARYDVLGEVAQRVGAEAVLLGHTLDDQAETVLLGLTRGSGGRSLAGMRRAYDVFHRPLLDLTRDQTRSACQAQGLQWWEDPHNEDEGYTRVRVRRTVLPVLEVELGPGIAVNLARTADLMRTDMEFLDDLAVEAGQQAWPDVSALAALPTALRTRVLRMAALAAGALDSELFRVHVEALDRLLLKPHLQVQLPGRITAVVDGGEVLFRPTPVRP